MRLRAAAMIALLVASLAGAITAWRRQDPTPRVAIPEGGPAETIRFDYASARLLRDGEASEARVHVTRGVPKGATAPLIVVLHGLNTVPLRGMWFDQPADLAALVDRLVDDGQIAPLLLAAPSQTKDAEHAKTLWVGMEIGAFADAVESALGGRAKIDRARIVLAGHSGAGCNPEGGLMTALRAKTPGVPRVVLGIDTCMDDEALGGYLGGRSDIVLRVAYERAWPRPFQRFCRGLLEADGGPADRACVRYDELGASPHDDILSAALAELLPLVLPPAAAPGALPSRPPREGELDPVFVTPDAAADGAPASAEDGGPQEPEDPDQAPATDED